MLTVAFDQSESISTVGTVRWRTDAPATGWVEYGPDENYGLRVAATEEPRTEHEVVLAGLPAASTWHWRAVSEVDGEVQYSEDRAVDTDPAPQALPLQTLAQAYAGEPRAGWTMTTSLGATSSVVLVDAAGQYCWWRELPEDLTTATAWVSAVARPSRDGRGVIYPTYATDRSVDVSQINVVSWDHSSERALRTPLGHHDFAELPDGTLAYPAIDVREFEGQAVVGDSIQELDPETEEIREIWNAWDSLDTGTIAGVEDTGFYPQGLDWVHINTLDYLEDRDAYLVSSRVFAQVWLIDRGSGEILWAFGRGGDFDLVDGEWFSDQHSPQLVGDRLVLFDNKADRSVSRVVEYEIDFEAMKAREAWSFEEPGGSWVYILGDAYRYEDGATLSSWGSAGYLAEVSTDGEIAWRLDVAVGNVLGQAVHVDSVGGPAQ